MTPDLVNYPLQDMIPKQKKITGCLLALALVKLSSPAVVHAYTAEDVTQMTLLDSGGGATIDGDVNHSQDAGTGIITKTGDGGIISNVSGELNLLSFTIGSGAGGVTYQAGDFISGVAPTTVIENGAGSGPATVGYVLQPADYLTATTNGRTTSNNSGFFAGSTDSNGDLVNGASYLTSGERGLSFSTSLNYRPSSDGNELDMALVAFKLDLDDFNIGGG